MAWSDTAGHDEVLLQPLSAAALARASSSVITCGPSVMRLRTNSRRLRERVAQMYAGYPGTVEAAEDVVADFTVDFRRVLGLPRFDWRLAFRVNGGLRLSAQSERLSFALFEWGANWCVSTYCQQYLAIHAAVVERNGHALVLPGQPGSGKSTLCATLVARGWRLLTDETAMFRLEDGLMVPVVRPISLKNQAIDVVEGLWPEATFGPRFTDTEKGTVAHVRAPDASIADMFVPAPPRAVLFPTFIEDQPVEIKPYEKAESFMFLASNSFNYDVLGAAAFHCLVRVVEQCRMATIRYGDGTAAAEAIEAEWP